MISLTCSNSSHQWHHLRWLEIILWRRQTELIVHGPITHESLRRNVNNMTPSVYFLLHFDYCFKGFFIIFFHLSRFPFPWLPPHFSIMFASLPLAVTEKNLITMTVASRIYAPTRLFIHLFWAASFHTECVGEETSSESKKEVDGKTSKIQPMKINIWSSWHVCSRFVIWQNQDPREKHNKTKNAPAVNLLKGDMVPERKTSVWWEWGKRDTALV